MTKRIAVYYRVSTEDQKTDSQKLEVEKWLSTHYGSAVIYRFEEKISGASLNRPEFDKVMTLAKSKQVEIVVVYKLDRFSRLGNQIMRFILELDDIGVQFISVTQPELNMPVNGNLVTRLITLALFASASQMERDNIAARTRAGVKAKRATQDYWGRRKQWTQEQLKEVHRLSKEGLSIRAIAAKLQLSYGTARRLLSITAT